jgi:integrase
MRRARNARPTTYGYQGKWQNYLAVRCSKLWMRDVRTCDIQKLLDTISQEHDLSRTSLQHVKTLLSAIFNHAKQQGYFDGINPVQGTAIPKARPAGETCAHSLEEINWMISILPEPAATIVATAAFTGLRRSEIQGLTWENYSEGNYASRVQSGETLRMSRRLERVKLQYRSSLSYGQSWKNTV